MVGVVVCNIESFLFRVTQVFVQRVLVFACYLSVLHVTREDERRRKKRERERDRQGGRESEKKKKWPNQFLHQVILFKIQL